MTKKVEGEWVVEAYRQIPVPHILVTKDFRIIDANYAALSEIGWDKGEVVGRKCYEIIGRSSSCEGCPLEEALEKDKPVVKVLPFCFLPRRRVYLVYPLNTTEFGKCGLVIARLEKVHREEQEGLRKEIASLKRAVKEWENIAQILLRGGALVDVLKGVVQSLSRAVRFSLVIPLFEDPEREGTFRGLDISGGMPCVGSLFSTVEVDLCGTFRQLNIWTAEGARVAEASVSRLPPLLRALWGGRGGYAYLLHLEGAKVLLVGMRRTRCTPEERALLLRLGVAANFVICEAESKRRTMEQVLSMAQRVRFLEVICKLDEAALLAPSRAGGGTM
ncbi:MAG TPA: hypothetical protein EYP65_03625, partial [Armatimonadetes bacterium]|nr:hypothetical protein [Armatimonadota bacterium]